MSKGYDRRRWAVRISLYMIAVSGLVSVGTLVMAASAEPSSSPQGYEYAIQSLENTISLLKWIGGAVITGLVSGIGLLYRALEKANTTIREDLTAGLQHRAELLVQAVESQNKLTVRVDALASRMEKLADTLYRGCPYMKEVEGK